MGRGEQTNLVVSASREIPCLDAPRRSAGKSHGQLPFAVRRWVATRTCMISNPSLEVSEPLLHDFCLVKCSSAIGHPTTAAGSRQRHYLWRWPLDRVVVDLEDAEAGHLGEIGRKAFEQVFGEGKDLEVLEGAALFWKFAYLVAAHVEYLERGHVAELRQKVSSICDKRRASMRTTEGNLTRLLPRTLR
jgi:hypothetical protein